MPEYSYELKRKKNKKLAAEFEERTQMFHEMIKQEKEKNKKAKLEQKMQSVRDPIISSIHDRLRKVLSGKAQPVAKKKNEAQAIIFK